MLDRAEGGRGGGREGDIYEHSGARPGLAMPGGGPSGPASEHKQEGCQGENGAKMVPVGASLAGGASHANGGARWNAQAPRFAGFARIAVCRR